jgi:hypothetical protein
MMFGTRKLAVLAAAFGALALVACGDSNPAGPSGSSGVAVSGVLLSEGASVAASSVHASAASGGTITVMVQGTSLSTTISGNGTFELKDVPPGTFTLVFFQNGTEIGRVTITADAGVQVKIVVRKQGVKVVLVDLEIDDGSDSSANDGCSIAGGRVGSPIELEGQVVGVVEKDASFTMTTQGNRGSEVITVNYTRDNLKCNGPKSSTCKVSSMDQVHVRGTLDRCDAQDTIVTAKQVMVQKSGNGS